MITEKQFENLSYEEKKKLIAQLMDFIDSKQWALVWLYSLYSVTKDNPSEDMLMMIFMIIRKSMLYAKGKWERGVISKNKIEEQTNYDDLLINLK
jgi:hypothetical protein